MKHRNYRHSRRFACDHCRAYKLRCERDSRMGTSCNRCLSTSLDCTTTAYPPQQRPGTAAPAPTPAQVQGQITTDGRDGSDGSNHDTNTTTTMSKLPHSKEPRPASNAIRTIPPLQPNFNSTSTRIGQTQPAAGKDIISGSLPNSKSQGQFGADINIMRHQLMDGEGDLSLDQDCLALDELDFSMPDICYNTSELVFREDDDPTVNVNLIAWQLQSSNSALPGGFMEAEKDKEPETDSQRHARLPPKSYKELLKLSLELIEDQELLDTQAPLTSKHKPGAVCSNSQQHHPINRMLKHTTQFWEMLKRISMTSDVPQQHCSSYERTATGSSSNISHGNTGQDWAWAGTADANYGNLDSSSLPSSLVSLPPQDHLLIVNLMTTYVYLVRSCEGVFTRLYNALEVSPVADSSSILNLPNLQFGEFQLHNNLSIQVKVFIELISSMLLRIEETLGISQVTLSKRSSLSENQNYRLSILNDPISISIREIILSQEKLQGGIYSGELAFQDVINNLKQLLDRK